MEPTLHIDVRHPYTEQSVRGIDLGRAIFSEDRKRLSGQIERAKFLLGISNDQIAASSRETSY